MLHNMTIRLIHADQLETIYLCHGITCQSGVIWDHWGQKVIFTKIVMMSSRPLTYVLRSHVNLGSFEFLGTPTVSAAFLVLLSSFWQHTRRPPFLFTPPP